MVALVLGFVVAGVIAGGVHTGKATASGASVSWELVSVDGRSECLPVASSPGAMARGLMGVRHVAEPLVFVFSPARPVGFWMAKTLVRLTGVWVGSDGRVFGRWRGVPLSTRVHRSVRPVSLVVEYGPRERVPAAGVGVGLTGQSCAMGPGL